MSRQSRQAELRKRMAEARSKLQISASSGDPEDDGKQQQQHVDVKPPPSAASSILKKPKYSSNSTTMNEAEDAQNNALIGLIGGYSSSEDEDQEAKAATVGKKRDVPTSPDKQDTKKRAKFSADIHVRAITSDEDMDTHQEAKIDTTVAMNQSGTKKLPKKSQNAEPKKELAGEKISDEVWDEFNALLDDEPDISAEKGGSDAAQQGVNVDTKPDAHPTQVSADTARTAAPSEKSKPKKKKKRKKQSTDRSYDNEAVNNVEQASYEARLARLVLLKSKLQKSKNDSTVESSNLKSVDFYDPSLAFDQGDDEEGGASDAAEPEESTISSYNEASESNVTTTSNTATYRPRISLAEILRKRRSEARQMSSFGEEDTKQNSDTEADGRWF